MPGQPQISRFTQLFCAAASVAAVDAWSSNMSPAAHAEAMTDAQANTSAGTPSATYAGVHAGIQITGAKTGAQTTDARAHTENAGLAAGVVGTSHARGNASASWPILGLGQRSAAVVRLQEGLAELGYLPVAWTPSQREPSTLSGQRMALNAPPAGRFTWKYANTPPSLKSLWQVGVYTVMVQGAVMAFEADHHLAIDGVAGPMVFTAISNDLLRHKVKPGGYSYLLVSKKLPETLSLWVDGRWVVRTPANTGIPAAPTPNGTWPIYLRFSSQTMSGYTPSGKYYYDPGVPWVSYFYHGCAVHGFARAKYGFPQSLGCVELPTAQAKVVWEHTGYGTLVTVTP